MIKLILNRYLCICVQPYKVQQSGHILDDYKGTAPPASNETVDMSVSCGQIY
jgi:hypothetical protein